MQRQFVTGILDKLLSDFSGNSSGNAPALLMLGTFKFSLNTAVFQSVQQSDSWKWRGQERTGQRDALQYTGPGDSLITLPGVLYPYFTGSATQMDDLRSMANAGTPYRLVTLSGTNLGMWVIDKLDTDSSNHTVSGDAQRVEFTLSLRKYSDGTNL